MADVHGAARRRDPRHAPSRDRIVSAIDRATALELYRVMRTIRAFEERATQLFSENKIWGTIHSYAGQEAVAAGVCAHLRDEDWITSTHRGHGHCIAKGADVGKMFAELLGRETGYCRGRGGSMHIADTAKGNLGANGVVGGGIPIATGAALTASYTGSDRVAVSFFGDGGVNQGTFHESANLAAIWKLPVIFVCENNQYAETNPVKDAFAIEDLSQRAAGYGMPGVRANGQDVREIHRVAGEAITRARAWIVTERLATEAELDAMDRAVDDEIERGVAQAEQGPPASPIRLPED